MSHHQSLYDQALQLHQSGQIGEAIRLYNKLLSRDMNNAQLLFLIGTANLQIGKSKIGIEQLQRSLALNPQNAFAHINHGNALKDLFRLEEALTSYDKALAINPYSTEGYSNRGNALRDLRRFDEALESYDKALAIDPDYVGAHFNRGLVLQDMRRLNEALASYDRALAINPYDAEIYNNRGNVLQELKRLDEALASYDKGLAIDPAIAEAHCNRGTVLKDLQRLDEALASYQKAYAIDPTIEFLPGSLVHTKMKLCIWEGFDKEIAGLKKKIAQNRRVCAPFIALGIMDSLATQKMAASAYCQARFPAREYGANTNRSVDHSKIRIGYYSADFRSHAVMHLIAEMLEKHHRDRFEVYAFSLGPVTNDPWQERARRAVDQFIDCRHKTDLEIVQLSRQLGIDIAVDLSGFTEDSRTGVFAARAAPLQVSFLGYPGTMGAAYMDYLIADRVLIPEHSAGFYSEKIVWLPHCYLPNCRHREISEKKLSRGDFDLPETGIVFCSFNNNYKITPDVFSSWMRILNAVDGSVFWLLATTSTAEQNLRSAAIRENVDLGRLVFAKTVPTVEEHLNRLRLADLMLDTFPYGAHTTCSDALRMGLPVITMVGESFASRVAASQLMTVGLPELITRSAADYEALAVELAKNPGRLKQTRDRLCANAMASPLFDSDVFTKNIESAYLAMYENHRQNLPVDHIRIS